jgi:hypothetical protein
MSGMKRLIVRNGAKVIRMERAFESYGVRFGITWDPDDVQLNLDHVLPPGSSKIPAATATDWFALDREVSGPGAVLRLTKNKEEVNRFLSGELATDLLESALQLHVAEFAEPDLFVHAGVVIVRGRAIVFPGRSFSGKSTLVAALVRAGADYSSDEYAVFSSEGLVSAYPRRISLRDGPLGPASRVKTSRADPGPDPVRIAVGLVLFSTYKADGDWHFELLEPATGVTELCQHTVAMRRRPRDAFDVFTKVVSNVPVLKGTRGEISEAVDQVFAMVHW